MDTAIMSANGSWGHAGWHGPAWNHSPEWWGMDHSGMGWHGWPKWQVPCRPPSLRDKQPAVDIKPCTQRIIGRTTPVGCEDKRPTLPSLTLNLRSNHLPTRMVANQVAIGCNLPGHIGETSPVASMASSPLTPSLCASSTASVVSHHSGPTTMNWPHNRSIFNGMWSDTGDANGKFFLVRKHTIDMPARFKPQAIGWTADALGVGPITAPCCRTIERQFP